MAKTRSDQVRGSRMKQGGVTEVSGDRLGWWERTIFPRSPLDVTIKLTRKYSMRPDLLAYDMYGKVTLQWFVLQYNNIIDVTEEFVEGATITLPTKSRLMMELLGKSN